MNRSKNIFAFLGVVLLAISLPISIYILKTGNLDFRISAFESDEPVDVIITDVTANSFKVSWITEKPVYGGVKLNGSVEPVSESDLTSYHSVTVKNLSPSSTLKFNLLSSGKSYETDYSVTTASVNNVTSNVWLYGQIFATDGITAQKGGIISLKLNQGNSSSQLLSTTINETGGYRLNIGSILNDKLSSDFSRTSSATITFMIYTDVNTSAITKTYTMDLTKSTQIPNIYLGDINIDVIPGN